MRQNKTYRSIVCLVIALVYMLTPVQAIIFNTIDKSIEIIKSPNSKVTAKTYYLSPEQQKQLNTVLNSKNDATGMYFDEIENNTVISRSYIDRHKVKSKYETVLIKMNMDHIVEHIEIIAFDEPINYVAKKKWMKQFLNKKFEVNRSLTHKEVVPVLGATLTSNSIEKAVRKVIMINQWLSKKK